MTDRNEIVRQTRAAMPLEERQAVALEQLVDGIADLSAEIGGLKATVQGLRAKLEGKGPFGA